MILTATIDIFTAAVISFAAGTSVGILMIYAPFFSKFSIMQKTLKQINEYFINDARKHADAS